MRRNGRAQFARVFVAAVVVAAAGVAALGQEVPPGGQEPPTGPPQEAPRRPQPGPVPRDSRSQARVVDADGKPVADAQVWELRFHDTDLAGDAEHGPIVVSRTETDAEGVAGPFGLRSGGGCFLAFEGDRSAFECDAPSELRLGPATTVRLRLTGAFEGLPDGARVRLFFPGTSCRHGIDPVSARGGVLVFPPLPADRATPERMTVEVSAAGWWSGPYPVPVASGERPREIRLVRSRTVRGRAVDEDGRPVVGAAAWAVRPEAPYSMDGVSADERGDFAIPDVRATKGRVYVRARGYAATRVDLPETKGDHDAGAVVLRRGKPLAARVVEEDGVDVVAYAAFVEDEDGFRVAAAECDGRGHFRVDALGGDEAFVRVHVHASAGVAGGRMTTAMLDLGKPEQTVVVPSGCRIRLVGEDGKPRRVGAASLRLVSGGQLVFYDEIDGEQYGPFAEFRLGHLDPGLDLDVAVTADDGSTGTAKVTLDADARGLVEIRLAPPK